jgi:hypothetical protein
MSVALTVVLVALSAGIFVSWKLKKTKTWELILLGGWGLLLAQIPLGQGVVASADTMSAAFLASFGIR